MRSTWQQRQGAASHFLTVCWMFLYRFCTPICICKKYFSSINEVWTQLLPFSTHSILSSWTHAQTCRFPQVCFRYWQESLWNSKVSISSLINCKQYFSYILLLSSLKRQTHCELRLQQNADQLVRINSESTRGDTKTDTRQNRNKSTTSPLINHCVTVQLYMWRLLMAQLIHPRCVIVPSQYLFLHNLDIALSRIRNRMYRMVSDGEPQIKVKKERCGKVLPLPVLTCMWLQWVSGWGYGNQTDGQTYDWYAAFMITHDTWHKQLTYCNCSPTLEHTQIQTSTAAISQITHKGIMASWYRSWPRSCLDPLCFPRWPDVFTKQHPQTEM